MSIEPSERATSEGAAPAPAADGAAALPGPASRSGEGALLVLATPLNLTVLRALAERPMRLTELRQAAGLPAQTTLGGHLASLAEVGVLRKRPTQQMPLTVENELTPMGADLLHVADDLEAWLAGAPQGPVALDAGSARGVIKAFVDGWSSTMMRALAARPMSLTELDRLIVDLSYPALERRLASMRMAGLVEACPGSNAGTPYALTDWARRGLAPLLAASRCERLHRRRQAAPVTRTDIEAAFLLATPLVDLPRGAIGSCRLEVEAPASAVREPAGVTATVEAGKVVACDSALVPGAATYAAGTSQTWFGAVIEGTPARLRFGGNRRLAESLVEGLHAALRPR